VLDGWARRYYADHGLGLRAKATTSTSWCGAGGATERNGDAVQVCVGEQDEHGGLYCEAATAASLATSGAAELGEPITTAGLKTRRGGYGFCEWKRLRSEICVDDSIPAMVMVAASEQSMGHGREDLMIPWSWVDDLMITLVMSTGSDGCTGIVICVCEL
jgi:hypothetical protein